MNFQPSPENKVLPARSPGLSENTVPYCPGCGHSVAQRLIADTIEALGLRDRTVGVIGAGCYTNGGMSCFDFPRLSSLHGRAPAVATGVKRARPDAFVFTLQGDGDLAAIGLAEIMHACTRGEKIAVVMLNNSTYGNTGGQMAPTTLVGQQTTTSRDGRAVAEHGNVMAVAEIIAALPGVRYAARGAVNNAHNLWRTRRWLRQAFEVAANGEGLGFVEILSQCPTFWGLDPVKALAQVDKIADTAFPLGELKGAELTAPLDVLLAGFGGQGILLAGQVLARAAMRAGLNVLVHNYYEGFVRGGISECTVVMAPGEIDSPVRSHPAVIAALDARALANWGGKCAAGGRLLVNSSLVGDAPRPQGVRRHEIPATALAAETGNPLGASLIVVGALAPLLGAFSLAQCRAALEEAMPPHRRAHLAKNLACLDGGAAFAETEMMHGAV